VKIDRKTLIVAGFAAFLFAFCVATFFLTEWAIKSRNPVAGFFSAAALMMAVYMFVWWMDLWIKQIRRGQTKLNSQDGPWERR